MALLGDFYKMGLDFIYGRFPLKVTASVEGNTTICITILNRTKDLPLVVNEVRIHYGERDYTTCFVVSPKEVQRIEPLSEKTFRLVWGHVPVYIKKMMITDNDTADKIAANGGFGSPGVDDPSYLFLSIARDKKHSWVEIDFNEFKRRKFLKGKIFKSFLSIVNFKNKK